MFKYYIYHLEIVQVNFNLQYQSFFISLKILQNLIEDFMHFRYFFIIINFSSH